MKLNIKILSVFFLNVLFLSAQNLPNERKVDWTVAGLTDTSTLGFIDVFLDNYGIVGDGVFNNDSVMTYVLDSIAVSVSRIHFPAGNFLFRRNVVLQSNTIIKGAGSEETILTFDMDSNEHSFFINGSKGIDTTFFTASALKDDNFIKVSNADSFEVGDWVQIIHNDSNLATSTWGVGTIGQIVQIKEKYSDSLVLNSQMRLSFELVDSPYILKLNVKQNIGIECLKILRMDNTAPFQASNIYFGYTVNSWVKGVESEYCTNSHIQARTSSNLHISKCFLHEGFEYGGGGRAYGVVLHLTTNECRVDNTIFKHLRHSMLLQAGANGNVFAYNYSIEPYRTELPNDFAGDLVLHGNYPFANLFEQNICQNLSVDNSHGPNGRYNTFFRNRAELFGIYFTTQYSPFQNVIGTEVTNTTAPYSGFNFVFSGIGHFKYANNNKGMILPDSTEVIEDISYAYASKPDFVPQRQWAKIGNPDSFDIVNIPAKDRFLDMSIANANCFPEVIEEDSIPEDSISVDTIIESSIYELETNLSIYPNPTSGKVIISSDKKIASVKLYDFVGKLHLTKFLNEFQSNLYVKPLSKGIYILEISFANGQYIQKKLVIE